MKTKKQLMKEISKLNQLNEVLACALYKKCGSVEEYTKTIENAVYEYRQLHITIILDRLKTSQEMKLKQSQQIGQQNE